MPDGTAPALTRVLRYDRASVEAAFEVTPEGYVRTVGRIAKPGILTYRGANGQTVRELVPESTLKDPEFLASLENKPLTVEHPPVMLTPENIGEYRKGMVLAPVTFADGYVQAPIQVDDADAIAAMRAGKVELSPGYEVDIDPTPGTDSTFGPYDAVQVKRYGGNHTALCDRARGGNDIRLLRTDSAVEVAPEAAADPASQTSQEPPVKLSPAMAATLKACGVSDDDIAACADDDAGHALIRALQKDDDKADEVSPEVAAMQKAIADKSAELEALKAQYAAKLEEHEVMADDGAPAAMEALADDGPMMDDDASKKTDSARRDSLVAGRTKAFAAFRGRAMEYAVFHGMALEAGVPRADADAMGIHGLVKAVAKRRLPAATYARNERKPDVLRELLTMGAGRRDSADPVSEIERQILDQHIRTDAEPTAAPLPPHWIHPNARTAK